MLPLLPFAAGLLAGAVAVKLLRAPRTREELGKVQDKARHGLEKAQEKLRDAAVSSLAVVESSSAAMKQRLSSSRTETPQTEPQAATAETAPPAAPAKAPRRKTVTTRKTAKKSPAASGTTENK